MTGLWLQAKVSGLMPQDAASFLASMVAGSLLPASSAEITWTEVQASDPLRDGVATWHEELPAGSVGTITGDCLPPQNTVRTTLTTGFKSARRRGGMYFPGLSETSVSGGHLIDPQLTAIQLFHANLLSALGGNAHPSWTWVIYSPAAPNANPPRDGILITPVAGLVTDTLVRGLHRRQIGVGV